MEDGGGWLIGKGVYSADLDFCCLPGPLKIEVVGIFPQILKRYKKIEIKGKEKERNILYLSIYLFIYLFYISFYPSIKLSILCRL